MAKTDSTNIDIEGIAEIILKEDDFAICGHTSPDGDCIGSTLGVAAILDALGKRYVALVADDDFQSRALSFMPGFDSLEFAGDFKGDPNIFICVDVPNDKRLGKFAKKVRDKAKTVLTIDHHEAEKNDSAFRYIDPDAASCTLIVWKLALEILSICSDEVLDTEAMRGIATCCYAGLLTDTGRFMFQNTNEQCFEAAAEMIATGIDSPRISSMLFQEKTLASIKLNGLVAERMKVFCNGAVVLSWLLESDIEAVGGTNSDTEDCINIIRSLEGTKIACLLKERNGSVRGSLRAKDDTNVAEIASEFGGGGHVAAAGFTMNGCDISKAIDVMKKRLCEVYSAGSSNGTIGTPGPSVNPW